MIISSIRQNGFMLEADDTDLSGQYSANQQLEVFFEDETFTGYALEWFCSYDFDMKYTISLEYDVEKKLITLPAECFKKYGNIYISLRGVKNDEFLATNNSAEFIVGRAGNPNSTVPSLPVQWEEIANQLIQQYFENQWNPQIDGLIKEAEKQQETAKELQAESAKQQEEVTRLQEETKTLIEVSEQQQKTVKELINNSEKQQEKVNQIVEEVREDIDTGEYIPKISIGNIETVPPTSDANVEIEGDFRNPILNFKIPQGKTGLKGDSAPPGAIMQYAGKTQPDGWLFCLGQAISRTEYQSLFNVIGTTYGSGDGSTTFNVPNLQELFPLGVSDTNELGSKGGAKEVALSVEEMPSHTHKQDPHTHSVVATTASAGAHGHTASSNSTGSHSHTITVGSGGAHTHSASGTATSAGTHGHSINIGSSYGSSDGYVGGGGGANKWKSGLIGDTQGAHTHSVSATAASAGSHAHSASSASAGGHSHTITVNSGGAHIHEVNVSLNSNTAVNQYTGGGKAHNNMPPYIALNFIIKI